MFYYRKGDILTNDPWHRPSAETFDNWLEEWSKTSGLNNYNVYLTGAFCQNYFFNRNIDTWDVDVTLEVKPEANINYYDLKHILEQGIKIGFQKKLLIDIFVVEDAFKFTNKKIKSFKYIIKKSNTEFKEWFLPGKITELIPGLYESVRPPIKETNKYLSKDYEVLSKKLVLPNNEY